MLTRLTKSRDLGTKALAQEALHNFLCSFAEAEPYYIIGKPTENCYDLPIFHALTILICYHVI